VRKLLKDKNNDSEITVRVVCIRNKTIPVSENLVKHYADTDEKFPEQFEYRHKALFVYQKQDDVDMCFFGMHVQEYGSDAPLPNRGRVYISYLDSVHYFKPKALRTEVYKELLIAYLEYCRNIGYSYAHIWACPPSFGDDYIFHCHPTEQKVPKPKRLQEWYKDMLIKAKERRVVHNFLDMTEWVRTEQVAYARQFPYFEGDFWPGMIEDVFKEIKAEEAEESKGGKGGKASKKGSKNKSKQGNKKGKGKGGGKKGKNSLTMGEEVLADRLLTTLEKLKDTFFVVYLSPPLAPGAPPRKIKDKDGDMTCELMDGRDGFLNLCRDNNLEFSELRRAKHSSLVMLYTLHVAESDFNYTCNGCEAQIAAMDYRWHCDSKDCGGDYDLCENCYNKNGHEHEMKKLGFGVGAQEGDSGKTPNELKRLHIQRCIDSLVHACQCTDTSACRDQSCAKMKQVVKHTRECPSRTDPKKPCHICKQLVALCCYHAKHCKTGKCQVPFCQSIKDRLKKQQLQARAREVYRNRRRQNAILDVNQPAPTPVAMNPNAVNSNPAMVGMPSQAGPARGAMVHPGQVSRQQVHPQQQQQQQRPPLSNVSPSERLQIVNHNIKMCRDYLSAMEKRDVERRRAGAPPPNAVEVAKDQKSVNEVKAKLVQLERARNQLRAPTPKQKEMLQQMINELRQLPHAQQLQTIRSYDAERAQLFKWYQQHTHNQKVQQQKLQQARQQQQMRAQQQAPAAMGMGNPVAPNVMAMHSSQQRMQQPQQHMQGQQMQHATMQQTMGQPGMQQQMQMQGMAPQQLAPNAAAQQQRAQMQQRMMGAHPQGQPPQGGDLLGNLADRL